MLNLQPYRPTDIVLNCGCGRTYNAIAFRELPKAGTGEQSFPPVATDPDGIELRNCPCGSTRAVAFIRVAVEGSNQTVPVLVNWEVGS